MPTEPTDLGAIRLGDVVRSNLWIIALTSVIGLLAGLGLSTRIETKSTATTPILLSPLDGNPFDPTSRGGQLVNLESEAQSVRSSNVAELARTSLESELTDEELLANVDVEVPINTQILDISYTSKDPEVATTHSQAFAEAYLDYRRQRAQTRIDEQAALLDEQIDAANARLTELTVQLSSLPNNSSQASVVEQQIDTVAGQVNTLEARRADLSTTPLDPGQVVTPAALEGSGPVTPARLLPLVGLLFGAIGGLLIGLLRSRADLRIRDPQAVLDRGLPVLGTIAWTDAMSVGSTSTAAQNDDDYRKIRVAILALEKRRPFTLLVASASSASTGPMSVVDLCTSFARAGLDTVVVDATAGRTGPSTILLPDATDGLAEVLLGDAVLTDALAPVAPLLWVLGPGLEIDTVADLFVGSEMDRLLDSAKDHCDIVIVAAGSLQQGVAQSLADVADAVVVEVDEDTTTGPELDRVSRSMDVLSSAFLGTVFVGRDAAKRTQLFRPHLAVHQRQLPPGPFAALEPVGNATEEPPEPANANGADDEPMSPQRPPSRSGGSNGKPAARRAKSSASGRTAKLSDDPAQGGQ